MAYLTQTGGASPAGDLTNALGNDLVLQLFSQGSGTADSTAIAACLRRSQSMVDGTLTGVFTVPFTTVPDIIFSLTLDIAIYYAYSRKPEFFRADGSNPWEKQYKNAMDILDKIRKGEIRLGTETAEKGAMVGGEVYGTSSYFIIDPYENQTGGPMGGF